jgi:hypothetical protein
MYKGEECDSVTADIGTYIIIPRSYKNKQEGETENPEEPLELRGRIEKVIMEKKKKKDCIKQKEEEELEKKLQIERGKKKKVKRKNIKKENMEEEKRKLNL